MSSTVHVNGTERELEPGTSLEGLVAGLARRGEGAGDPLRGFASAVNGTVVPRSQWAATVIGDGDRVEVVTAVQGG